MWNNRQFWSDALWRALRTFSQTWEGILTAYAAYLGVKVAGALKDPAVQVDFTSLIGGWGLWALFLLASLIAAARSVMQSIDRERAVESKLPSIVPADEPAAALVSPARMASPVTDVVTACGDALR